MAELEPQTAPPFLATPLRRAWHTLVAAAGWVLFAWWWWLVFQRVSDAEVRFTIVFVAVSLAAIVVLTVAWAIHNVRIFRRKGPRRAPAAAPPEPTRDTVGRELRLPGLPEACRTAPMVTIRVDGGTKIYEPREAA